MYRFSIFSFPLSALSFLLCTFSLAQKSIPDQAPPNTAKLYDNLYIDKTEIANIQWVEFLNAVRRDSGLVYYQNMLPDSTLIEVKDPIQVHFTGVAIVIDTVGVASNDYMRSPETLNHPVVGITHEQAKAYCAWRSKLITAQAAAGKGNFNVPSGKKIKFEFRLPTEEEWMYAASSELDTAVYAYGFKDFQTRSTLLNNSSYYWGTVKRNSKLTFTEFEFIFNRYQLHGREPFFNCLKDFYGYFHYGTKQPESALPSRHKKPIRVNGFGLYNMIGNVAEMTDRHGLAKGGSWAHLIEQCRIGSRQYYTKPESWLGFRCVCEVMITD